MNKLKIVFVIFISIISINTYAFVITDAISFNQHLEKDTYYAFEFDMQKQGYNPLTDSITFVSLTYDFSELVDDGHDPDNMETWESAEFFSHIFASHAFDPDVAPGIQQQLLAWNKINECQYYDDAVCTHNLDLNGKVRETVIPYTDNLWLNSVAFSIDVERANIPEPSSIILLACGLMVMGWNFHWHTRK